jgi:hypothetical protein
MQVTDCYDSSFLQVSCPRCSYRNQDQDWWSAHKLCPSPVLSLVHHLAVMIGAGSASVLEKAWSGWDTYFLVEAQATAHTSITSSPSSETRLRISFPWSWALWPQRTQPHITVQETQWRELSVSPDTNLPAGANRTSRGRAAHSKHSLSPNAGADGQTHELSFLKLWFLSSQLLPDTTMHSDSGVLSCVYFKDSGIWTQSCASFAFASQYQNALVLDNYFRWGLVFFQGWVLHCDPLSHTSSGAESTDTQHYAQPVSLRSNLTNYKWCFNKKLYHLSFDFILFILLLCITILFPALKNCIKIYRFDNELLLVNSDKNTWMSVSSKTSFDFLWVTENLIRIYAGRHITLIPDHGWMAESLFIIFIIMHLWKDLFSYLRTFEILVNNILI